MKLFLALLVCVLWVGATCPGFAQQKTPATTTGTPAPKGKPKPQPAASGCFEVTVQVDAKKLSGQPWDAIGAPDPFVRENSSGASATCKDTFACSLIVRTSAAKLSLFIEDRDLRFHDEIGTGSCRPGSQCHIGAATVSSRAC